MGKFTKIVIALLFLISINVPGQDTRKEIACFSKLDKSYVTDGQDHRIVVQPSKYTCMNLFFYPEFTYKIIACCNDQTIPVEIKLTDNKGALIFSNDKVNYNREWDFTSASFLRGVLKVKLASKEHKNQIIKIIIAYKLTEKK